MQKQIASADRTVACASACASSNITRNSLFESTMSTTKINEKDQSSSKTTNNLHANRIASDSGFRVRDNGDIEEEKSVDEMMQLSLLEKFPKKLFIICN